MYNRVKPLSSFSPRYSWPALLASEGRSFLVPESVLCISRISPDFIIAMAFFVLNIGIGQRSPRQSNTSFGMISWVIPQFSLWFHFLVFLALIPKNGSSRHIRLGKVLANGLLSRIAVTCSRSSLLLWCKQFCCLRSLPSLVFDPPYRQKIRLILECAVVVLICFFLICIPHRGIKVKLAFLKWIENSLTASEPKKLALCSGKGFAAQKKHCWVSEDAWV